jgi:hypothetical protein
MLVLQTSVLNKLPMECFFLQINGTNYRTTLWCHRASGMKNSTIMHTQKHSSRRGLRRGRGVLYICRQKSQFADYRYKFSRNMCPYVALFFRKVPLENVPPLNFFMLGAPISHTPTPFPLSDSPVRPAWRYISVGPVSGII